MGLLSPPKGSTCSSIACQDQDFANSIPLRNFLVMSGAVAGATALWVERLKT